MTQNRSHQGAVGWRDLTVADAEQTAEFYGKVVGWEIEEVELDGYHDYLVKDSTGQPVAGICNARGVNADLPSQWLIYIHVTDLDESIANCESLGGSVICPQREMGQHGTLCVIRDPAGAVAALLQPPE